ncbi:hypothetical protein E8E13_009420 [Curvularia kusanoi]|uniref:DUF7587 domain-containing protein n=1 Tax=Curvularia kusanoi TaxID=90978 RepID=A0A9P4THF2_CURKU|nr:hypothetical protein E8E13_009420 [Curvularia kusanoi]
MVLTFFPLSSLPDLGRLVQDRLNIVNQQFPTLAPNTLDDFRIVADELSSIASICQATTNILAARGEIHNAAEAFRETKRALEWAEFLAAIKVDETPSQRTLLFRAHNQPATDQSGSYTSAALRIPFDDDYRQRYSVQEFLKSLGMHLGKRTEETKSGRMMETTFTSTSPKLEWALHLTGQKARAFKENVNVQVDFVIFDLQALRRAPQTHVFRVEDVLRFLETSNQTNLILADYQDWARACDEYLIMGRGIEKGIVQITPSWKVLSTPIIVGEFHRSFTLGLYKKFLKGRVGGIPQTNYEQACKDVVLTAKVMAGQKSKDIEFVQHLVSLILKPELSFWGIRVSRGDAEIAKGCEGLLEDGLVAQMSQISI